MKLSMQGMLRRRDAAKGIVEASGPTTFMKTVEKETKWTVGTCSICRNFKFPLFGSYTSRIAHYLSIAQFAHASKIFPGNPAASIPVLNATANFL